MIGADAVSNTIEIPLKESPDEVIELDFTEAPDGEEVISILRQEQPPLYIWVAIAREYYKHNELDVFVRILESSGSEASLDYENVERDQMAALDTLAAHYVNQAHGERQKETKRELFSKATLLYTTADKIVMYEQSHLLGRAYFCLLEGDKVDQADAQFNFVLNQQPSSIPALLGKACIAYQKRDYRNALFFYKKALKFNPRCPADLRLGMGHCFAKLGRFDKARLAFTRALELDDKCVGAMVGLAVLDVNEHTAQGIRSGVQLLSRAYALTPGRTHPMVLNHLANHFFFKKDYEKVSSLALHAFHSTENEAMRAESCYQLARGFHVQNDYDQAFQYYYQATQFASSSFLLPFYGLGQMYIYREDLENAIVCFDKVHKQHANNYETMKILGSLYAHTACASPSIGAPLPEPKQIERRALARTLLAKVLEQLDDDIEVWIEYAQLLEETDAQASLHAYEKAIELLTDVVPEIPPELLNNVASLHFSVGNKERAQELFTEALAKTESELQSCADEHRLSVAAVQLSIKFNLARTLEALSIYDKAERMYKDIVSERPSYIDCHLRLGCMARDRGQIYDASSHFKDALSVNQSCAEAWSLIGNLHMSKLEWGPAQKKYEHILKFPDHLNDAYSLVALGNVWLETLYMPTKDKQKQKRHRELALGMYTKALRVHSSNIWAANGVGCVLAAQGLMQEARDVFAQVREATADFPDVWLNIAHVYVEQKQHVPAIQMYENCMRKFKLHHNVDLLLYLARAYFRASKYEECKQTLLKARMVAPHDLLLVYNTAFVLKYLATSILKQEKSSLDIVSTAVANLGTAKTLFAHLADKATDLPSSTHHRHIDRHQALAESNQCADLTTQAMHHVQRAAAKDKEEKEARERQAKERRILEEKTAELLQQQQSEEQKRLQELHERRQQFIEQTREIRCIPEAQETPKHKQSRGGGGGAGGSGRGKHGAGGDEFVNDSSDLEFTNADRAEGGAAGKESASKRADRKRQKRERRLNRQKERDKKIGRRKEVVEAQAGMELSAKQKLKIKSKEYVSSSDDSGPDDAKKPTSDNERPDKPKAVRTSSDSSDDGKLAVAKNTSDSDNNSGSASPKPKRGATKKKAAARTKSAPRKRRAKLASSSGSGSAQASGSASGSGSEPAAPAARSVSSEESDDMPLAAPRKAAVGSSDESAQQSDEPMDTGEADADADTAQPQPSDSSDDADQTPTQTTDNQKHTEQPSDSHSE